MLQNVLNRARQPCAIGVWIVLFAVALVAVTLQIARPAAKVGLRIDAQATEAVQVYWSEAPKFTELDSTVLRLTPGIQKYEIRVSDRGPLWFRFDQMPNASAMTVCGVARQPGGWSGSFTMDHVRVESQAKATMVGNCLRITPDIGADDPHVILFIDRAHASFWRKEWRSKIGFLVVALFFALFWWNREHFRAPAQAIAAQMEARLPQLLLGLGLLCGGAMALVTPSGAVPDEHSHMAKAALVAQGQLWGHGDEPLRVSINQLEYDLGRINDQSRPFERAEVIERSRQSLKCGNADSSYPRFAAGYSPMPYAASAAALNVSCELGLSVGEFVHGVRLLNLAIALGLAAIGLAYAGSGRWALFVVALLPMSLFEMASVTADSLTLGLSLCLLGLFSGLAGGKLAPTRGTTAVLCLLAVLLALSKPGFAWVLAAFFLCRHAYPSGKAFIVASIWVVALPWVVHLLTVVVSSGGAAVRPGVDSAANIASLTADPQRFGGLLSNTFFGDGMRLLWQSSIGQLGWLDVSLTQQSYALGGVLLLGSALLGATTDRAPLLSDRLCALLLAAGAAIMLSVPLFVYWTPTAAQVVEGLQGRYFLVAILLPLMWLTIRTGAAVRAVGGLVMVIGIGMLNADAIGKLIQRYYS